MIQSQLPEPGQHAGMPMPDPAAVADAMERMRSNPLNLNKEQRAQLARRRAFTNFMRIAFALEFALVTATFFLPWSRLKIVVGALGFDGFCYFAYYFIDPTWEPRINIRIPRPLMIVITAFATANVCYIFGCLLSGIDPLWFVYGAPPPSYQGPVTSYGTWELFKWLFSN